jgi:hypothetical protein
VHVEGAITPAKSDALLYAEGAQRRRIDRLDGGRVARGGGGIRSASRELASSICLRTYG